MTFKHTSFSDSPTMRSLEKVAYSKGWLPEQPKLTKQAEVAPVQDLQPSRDLTVNLLKLCGSLRTQGFTKQADEIESKMMTYKQASVALYNVSGETGDDLLGTAHPKGSHKMLDVDSKEATFEDLLDKHMQILKVVEKKPTGKLSNASEILNAVKTVLSQEASSVDRKINHLVDTVLGIINRVGNMVKDEMTVFGDFQMIQNRIKNAATNPILDNLNEIVSQISAMKTRVQPHNWVTLGLGGITEDTWAKVEPLLDLATRYANNAIAVRKTQNSEQAESMAKQYDPEAQPEKETPKVQDLGEQPSVFADALQQVEELKSKIQAWRAAQNVAQNPGAIEWITKETSALDNITQRYSKVPKSQQENMALKIKEEIETQIKDIDTFDSYFINPKAQ